MNTLRIRNWDKWQSYRSDRGQPPWIKVHRALMRDPNWVSLTDAQRGQLVAIWMLAADRNGVIPASPEVIRKLCFMDSEPDLSLFTERGFIDPPSSRRQGDAKLTSGGRQHDAPEKKREEESREEAEEKGGMPSGFEGKVIRLTSKHLNQWRKAYSALDVDGELLARDAWLAGEAPAEVRKNWFISTSKYLANRNIEARAKSAMTGGGRGAGGIL